MSTPNSISDIQSKAGDTQKSFHKQQQDAQAPASPKPQKKQSFDLKNKMMKDADGTFYVMEEVDLSVPGSEISIDENDAAISDIDDIKASAADLDNLDDFMNSTKKPNKAASTISYDESPLIRRKKEIKQKDDLKSIQRPAVVDDFFRNFLSQNKMTRSLQTFQQEWYELAKKGKYSSGGLSSVPDVYIMNTKLMQQIDELQQDLQRQKLEVDKAHQIWEKLRKERDFHKMHHQRVQQEKQKMSRDLERLKQMHKTYESKYEDLGNKYEAAMKEKMLLKLERDRLIAKSESLTQTVENLESKIGKDMDKTIEKSPQLTKSKSLHKLKTKATPFPNDDRPNPHLAQTYEQPPSKGLTLNKSFKKAHMMSVSCLGMHPRKSIIATGSDDMSWKIWSIPNGDLIMSGEGHKDWISGVKFHPKGTHLATCSGDSTVKVWDFVNASCVHSFSDHVQPVWNIDFNDTGDFLVSGSMDHTCKLYDLNIGKSRQTFRGHVDSVNHVIFKPYTNTIATASADKTVSLWDIRSGLCTQTFYGHLNAVNHLAFPLKADSLATCDSDGIVKIWDIKMCKERNQLDAGNYSANTCAWDKSGTVVAVGSDDALIRFFNAETSKLESTIKGHEDSVQDVSFDYTTRMLVSVGSDASILLYN